MEIKETVKRNKKSITTILSMAIAATLLLSAFTANGAGNSGSSQNEDQYKESAVVRGDIIVGVTETATATLNNHSVTFEVSGKIEDVFVKAGQQVKAGDPVASMATISIQDEIDTLNTSYQDAAIKLSDAQLAQQKGELDAKSTYDSTLNKSDTAGVTYQMTVEKLEQTVTEAQDNISEINKEVSTYKLILGYSYDEDYDDEDDVYDYTDSANYRYKYDKDFKDSGEVEEAISDAKKRLESAKINLVQAEYNLQIQKSEAGLSQSQTVSKAQLADDVYKMEMQSLQNNIASKQLSLQSIQKQINTYKGYLENNILYAPCDGIVTAVNNKVGDSFQSDAVIASISDPDNAFVYIAVAQDDVAELSIGQQANVTMDAFEEIIFDAAVDSITTTPVRNASGSASYTVTIKLDGDTDKVFEGMTGSATLITRQQKDVVYVSTRTVYDKDGASYVKVKRDDGTIEEVLVETGFSDGRNVEITNGINEGWTVIIESQVAQA